MHHVRVVPLLILVVGCKGGRLSGTDLPQDQEECEERGGSVIGGRCWFFVNSKDQPDLFRQCVGVGGGQSSDEGAGATCKIIYQDDAVCLGNVCD